MVQLPKKRFETLDSFRGICALLVVCFHARIQQCVTETTFFRNGNYFVEFFFVLSGFVIFHTYGKKTFTGNSFKSYTISRFFRIFPLHLVTLAVFITIELAKFMAEKNGLAFNNPAFVGNSAPSEILPNALLLQSWLPNANTLSFNIVAWSISVEFYIYLIFGLLLFGNNSVKTTGIVLLAATGLLCLYFEVDFVKSAVARGLLCFFMGCLIYMIYEKIYTLSMGKGVSSVIESLLLIAIVAILVLMPVGNIKNILVTFLFALTVLVFALEAGLISSFFKTGFLKYLGKLSYSIYIVHYVIWQILLSVAIIVSKLFKKELTFADGNVRVIATGSVITDYLLLGAFLVAVILVSHFTYNRIELKWMAFGKKYNAAAKEALVKN